MPFRYPIAAICFLFLIMGNTPVFSQCPPPDPLVFGDASCTPKSFTLSAIDSPDTYNWYDVPTGGLPIYQGDFFTTPLINTTTTYYVTSFDSGNNCESTRVPVQAIILPDSGNPTVYGSNKWNVYCFNDINWTDYKGFYIHNLININTAARWGSFSNPSSASGYTGCPVNFDNHSISYKRQGFPPGIYTIDILDHNDDFTLTINGSIIMTRVGFGQSYNRVWTGLLDGSSLIEYKWLDRQDASSANVVFTAIGTPTDLYAGNINYNQAYCVSGDPAALKDSLTIIADRNSYVRSGSNTPVIAPGELITNTGAPDSLMSIYLSFDVSSIRTSSFNNVYLYLRSYDRINYPNKLLFVSSVADTLWNESFITWSNKPVASSPPIASSVIYDINEQWYKFDISAYILAQRNAGNKRISLMLNDTTSGNNPLIFFSKDTAFPPVLVVNNKRGGCTGYAYQWQYSPLCNNVWGDVSGATSDTYDPSTISDSTCYRLQITDGCGNIAYSNILHVNIDAQTVAGKLTVSEIDIQSGTIQINGEVGKIRHWEVSEDNFSTTPTNITSNATQISYSGSSTSDLYYRAQIKSGACPLVYSDTIKILRVQEFIIFNSFSPNGDGINDAWKINGIERYPENKVSIVNFMGVPIYQAERYNNEEVVWQGNSGGQSLPDGTYYYSIQIPDKPTMTGYVIIKR
ncbi:MAG: gliding motility-associated C-terminal domain-containing protein [Cytophagaceae bacterium]|nr:gliding motility-associated C-terminal domain-containing protein [Cytophagaceae bacterium]